MGYLSTVFDTYYYSSDEKQKINLKNGFKNIVWGTLPYTKLNRFFKYRISYDKIKDDGLLKLFEEYSCVDYKILKSRYNINELSKESLIKARINSNYGKYFDKEIYLRKEYYRALVEYKNIYFKYINNQIDSPKEEIIKNSKRIKLEKEKSLKDKYNMNWNDYKMFVNECFDKIFDNYVPIDKKIEEGDFIPNYIIDWDVDNYVLRYVNKSLNGYLKDYIKEVKGIKWKNSLGKYLKFKGVTNKYTPLQLCIGRYYKTKNDLLKVPNDSILKLTKRQRQLINQIKEIIDKYDEKDIILFNEYEIPYINQAFITEYIKDKYKWNVITMIEIIYNRINSGNKYCIVCGKLIKSKSNNKKYCKKCAKKEWKKYNAMKQREYYQKKKRTSV